MFNLFSNFMQELPMYLMRIPVLLIALTVHESAHGWAAYKMGDPTARNFGRITLNPLKHLDPIGALMMLLFGFGWAKPVPINARNFDNPRRGMALSAAAGPASNLILGFLGILVYSIAEKLLMPSLVAGNMIAYAVLLFLMVFYSLNIGLAIFNLIPIPPLDGSRMFFILLPPKLYFGLMKYEHMIMVVMMLLLFFTDIITGPVSWIISMVIRGMFWLCGLLPFI